MGNRNLTFYFIFQLYEIKLFIILVGFIPLRETFFISSSLINSKTEYGVEFRKSTED